MTVTLDNKRWWALRGAERQEAKAEEAKHRAESLPFGSIKLVEQDGAAGFLGSGGFWPGRNKAGRLAAQSGLPSYPALEIIQEGDTFSLRGKSGRTYALYLDTVHTFRACYRSAIHIEKRTPHST